MPEVSEVAHACALLRRNVIGLRISKAILPPDHLLFPALKSAEKPSDVIIKNENQLMGAVVRGSGRHGKYFWLRFETRFGSPLVMLMHFGMTGRIRLRDVHSHMIFMENGGDKKVLEQISNESGTVAKNIKEEDSSTQVGNAQDTKRTDCEKTPDEWPPRFTKFELLFSDTTEEQTIDLAFSDPRRLARVRFLSGEEYATDFQLLSLPPLDGLGPDYSKKGSDIGSEGNKVKIGESDTFEGDPDPCHHGRPRLSFENFGPLVLSKKKPIKAFLLDQEFFAGIGNWVSDEILYHARIHPAEVISKMIKDPSHPVLRRLYDAIVFIMEESVRVEGDARLFPEDWLMLHRWGKGRKEPKAKTSLGHDVDFETVGGRTSCFVPEVQKRLKSEGKEVSKAVKNLETNGIKKTIKDNTYGVEMKTVKSKKLVSSESIEIDSSEMYSSRASRSTRSRSGGKEAEVKLGEHLANKRRKRNDQ